MQILICTRQSALVICGLGIAVLTIRMPENGGKLQITSEKNTVFNLFLDEKNKREILSWQEIKRVHGVSILVAMWLNLIYNLPKLPRVSRIQTRLIWFDLRLMPIFATVPAVSKIITCFKSGQVSKTIVMLLLPGLSLKNGFRQYQ